eukprot:3786008-Pyramimonas_sp.AAC.2
MQRNLWSAIYAALAAPGVGALVLTRSAGRGQGRQRCNFVRAKFSPDAGAAALSCFAGGCGGHRNASDAAHGAP